MSAHRSKYAKMQRYMVALEAELFRLSDRSCRAVAVLNVLEESADSFSAIFRRAPDLPSSLLQGETQASQVDTEGDEKQIDAAELPESSRPRKKSASIAENRKRRLARGKGRNGKKPRFIK